MLRPFASRVRIVDMEVGTDDVHSADIVLFDTFASKRDVLTRARELLDRNHVQHVVLYTWDSTGIFRRSAEAGGLSEVVLKSVTGERLVEALEDIAAGRPRPPQRSRARPGSPDHPVPGVGQRDTELLALIGLGLTNEEIARQTLLSPPTVRAYVRRLCRRVGVRERAELATRATELGLLPNAKRRNTRAFPRSVRSVALARAFVVERLEQYGVDEVSVDAFRLAVSELGSNAVAYSSISEWSVRLSVTADWCSLEVIGGIAASDSELFTPSGWTTAGPEAPSGRGLGIVRTLMDEIDVDTVHGSARVRCRRRRVSADPAVSGGG
jgi:DNA-binding NarL/FixJ family response regulator/anti-sigma regulatory factor (Ser/Thr protein kinase)